MASLDRLEGDLTEGVLLLLLCAIVLAAFYFGGGQDLALAGIRKVANAVDEFFVWLINIFNGHPIADAASEITGTDTASTGSVLGFGDFDGGDFDASDLPDDDSQLPDLSQIFG